jgi:hypothetical protein
VGKKLDYKVVGLVVLFLICWMGYCPLACEGTVVWSDDFNDGDYDGWTICDNTASFNGSYGFSGSNWSAANNYLQLDHEYWGIITHPSSVAYGTWSFDLKANETQVGLGTGVEVVFISNNAVLTSDDYGNDSICCWLHFHVFSHEEPYNYTISLGRRIGENVTTIDSYTKVPVAGWQHFDVTRNTTGWFSVYLNDSPIPIMEGEETEIDTSELFWLWFEDWQMIDNIVVDDEILPPTEPPDWLTIGIIGASAVVIIAVLVIILRRR